MINNNSKLPANFTYVTEKRLGNVIFSFEKIGNTMQGVDLNKADGQDKTSIRMLNFQNIRNHLK